MKRLRTAHGDLSLPAFLPDATRAAVRTVDSRDLEEAGVEAVMVNALHLSSRPGASAVEAAGGVHRFMGWRGIVASDSGGFQVYSLASGSAVSERGFTYRLAKGSGKGGGKETLTPEKSIRRQLQLGADIVFCLDYCTHPDAPADVQRESVARTVAWARRCREEFGRRDLSACLPVPCPCLRRGRDRQAARQTGNAQAGRPEGVVLFAVVQGGADRDLRKRCAEELLEIGFDGYAYGGWPVDSRGRLVDTVEYVADLVPDEFPLHALGIGRPESVVRCARMGYDLFDCTLPTRDARHGRLYVSKDGFASLPEGRDLSACNAQAGGRRGPVGTTSLTGRRGDERGGFYEYVRIADDRHRRDGRPVEDGCDCRACRSYSRAYLRHLFEVRDPAGMRLATLHNLRFYARLIERLRARAG